MEMATLWVICDVLPLRSLDLSAPMEPEPKAPHMQGLPKMVNRFLLPHRRLKYESSHCASMKGHLETHRFAPSSTPYQM